MISMLRGANTFANQIQVKERHRKEKRDLETRRGAGRTTREKKNSVKKVLATADPTLFTSML